MNSEDFLRPEAVQGYLQLSPGMRVADFGSGSGEFCILIAKLIGEEGIVTAVDVRTEPLEALTTRAKTANLHNIELVRANLEILGSSKLKDGSQDRVLLANILFQSNKKGDIVTESARVLKSGGSLIVIDWMKSAKGFGPPDEYRIKPEELQSVITEKGLTFESNFNAGAYHFGMVFKKP